MSDPFFASVDLLLSCDGVNGSTSFPDKSSNNLTMTAHGVTVSTAEKRFGTGSMIGGGYLSTPITPSGVLDITLGTFTVEFWVRFAGSLSYNPILSIGNSQTASGFRFYVSGGAVTFQSSPILWEDIISLVPISLDTWYHVALVRQGGDCTLYVDGVGRTSAAHLNVDTHVSPEIRLGNDNQGGFLGGYLDEIRITRGVARYTSNFTPPSAPFDTADSTVPNVIGLSQAAAEAAILAAGLTVGTIAEEFSAMVAAGIVFVQTLDPGDVVLTGTALGITVSLGPPDAPTPPSNLHTTSVTRLAVHLAWNPSSTGGLMYAVYRGDVLIGTTAPDEVVFTDTDVVPGASYRYTVAAWDEVDLSERTSDLLVAIPSQLVFPPVAFAALGDAKPRVYEPKENLVVRGRE